MEGQRAMTFGSLFSGIGGLDLGFEREGFKAIWQVEINPFCQTVLSTHFPDTKLYPDIRQIKEGDLENVDGIVGGFPCQPVSCAGNQLGEGDPRWLWPEFKRIICLTRPRWVLVENVRGLLSIDSGLVFGGILRDLASIGYDAEWQVLPASAFGAPHKRERLFLLSYPNNVRLQGRGFTWERQRVEALAQTTVWRNPPTPYVCRGTDGIPDWLDRLKVLGNAVVPQVAQYLAQEVKRSFYS